MATIVYREICNFYKHCVSFRALDICFCYGRDSDYSLVIVLDLAIWSGNKCMMEIAESTTGPSITIIRRAGWLREDVYPVIEPQETDEGMQLHQKWVAWVQQESRKR